MVDYCIAARVVDEPLLDNQFASNSSIICISNIMLIRSYWVLGSKAPKNLSVEESL